MKRQDYEQLTWFPEDSPASHSVRPGSKEARRTTVTSGRKCLELSRISGPLGSLVKMCLASSIWHSTRCCLTWKLSATPRNRLLFRLVVSTPPTDETGSALWPTVRSHEVGDYQYDRGDHSKKRMTLTGAVKEPDLWPTPREQSATGASWAPGRQGSPDLQTMVAMYPTPTTGAGLCGGTGNFQQLKKLAERGVITEEDRRQMSQGNGGKLNPEFVEWMMGYEQQFTKLIPTPTATDYKGGATTRCWQPSTHTHTHTRAGLRRPAEKPGGSHAAGEDWPTEPGVGRVAHGIPNRVDRIKCLGNAVVPQQFYPFFAAIAEIEKGR